MTVTDIIKSRGNKALPQGLPKDVPDTASPDIQSLIHAGTPPLTTYTLQQSRHLIESRQLVGRNNGHVDFYSILQTSRLPLLSGAFDYILKRAAFIPSILYRKLDLPWFRHRFKTGGRLPKPGEKFSNPIKNSVSLEANGHDAYTSLPSSYDLIEGDYPFQESEEGSPSIIGNPVLPTASADESIHKIPVLPVLHLATILPLISKQTSIDYQTEAMNTAETPDKSQNKTLGRRIFQPSERNQVTENWSNAVRDTAIGTDRQSQFVQRISHQPLPSTIGQTAGTIQYITEVTAQDSSNIIGMEEASRVYDSGSQSITSAKQSVEGAPRIVPNTVSREKTEVTGRTVTKESTQPSTPVSSGMVGKSSLKPSSLQDIVSPEKVVTDYGSSSQLVTNAEQSVEGAPRIVPNTVSREKTEVTGRTVTQESTKPSTPVSSGMVSKSSLKLSSLQGIMSSVKVVTDYDSGQPVSNAEQSAVSASATIPDTISRKSIPTVNTFVSRKVGQTSIPRIPIILNKLSTEFSPVREVPLPEKSVADDNSLPLETGIEQEITTKIEPSTDTISKKDTTISSNATHREIRQPIIPEISNIPDKISTKPSPLQTNVSSEKFIADTGKSKPGTVSDTVIRQKILKRNNKEPVKASMPPLPGTPHILASSSIKESTSQWIASTRGVSLSPHHSALEQANAIYRSRKGEIETNQPTKQILHESEVMPISKETKDIMYNRDTRDTIVMNDAGANNGRVKGSANKPLFYQKMHSKDGKITPMHPHIGNISDRIVTTSQRISRFTGYPSLSEQAETQSHNNGYVLTSPGYWYDGQQLPNLPVVSSIRPARDSGATHSGDISRVASDTVSALSHSKPFHMTNLAPTTVRRTVETPVSNEPAIIQRQEENSNNQDTIPNIRVLADKVYALLRQELKIERERERHQRLR
jgi:hypothetical protein